MKRMPVSRFAACIISAAAMFLAGSPAQAEIVGAHVAITPPGSVIGDFIESVSISTMSYVTNSPVTGQKAYIEILGHTGTNHFQLRIQSKDQERVLAFWEQIAQATAAQQEFLLTVYSIRTFQVGEAAGYVGDLDIGWNYFSLR
jgi:hypothetical protein